jgi:4-amino-4-deoxy-L-arabinose transferase-like glycosyltransferase
MSRPSVSVCLLIICSFWAAIYLPALAKRELQGEEARRVLPGRTMMQNGDWMLPRSGGAIYNRKPPLVNWMSAAAIKLTGRMDEWTVRFPSTLMMLAMGAAVFLFLRGWLGNDQALLVALIALTSIGFIEKGRLIEIEALYMSLFGIALAAWLGLRWRGSELAAWIVSGLVLGLGFLAKGPPHLLFFYGIVIGVMGAEKKLRDLLNWRHLVGLLCFFAVWVPWAVLNSQRNVQRDSGKVWADQITHRLGFAEFDFVNYLLQVPMSLVNFLPWALLLPLCWRVDCGGDRHGQWMRGMRKGLVWAFFIVALLPSSRPRFLLPLNVAAAILVADALARQGWQRLDLLSRRWRAAMLVVAGVGVAALLVAPWTQVGGSTDWILWHWIGWLLWLPVLAMMIVVLKTRPWRQPIALGIATASVLSIAISAFAFQTVSRSPWREPLRDLAASIIQHTGDTDPILLVKVGERMWPFYLGMRCYETELLKDCPRGIKFEWLIVDQKAWQRQLDRANLVKRFGQPDLEMPLKEPYGNDDYVLVHMKK